MGRASQFLAVYLLFSFALAGHVRAWNFDFRGFVGNGPLAYLRSSLREKLHAPRQTYPTTPPEKNGYYDGNLQLSPQPCILEDLRTIAACACSVARELNPHFPVRERDFCIDVLKLTFKEMWKRCEVFRDYNHNLQRFRLTHVIFNSITVCPVERVRKETAEARRKTQTPKPSRSPYTVTPTKEPPYPWPYTEAPTYESTRGPSTTYMTYMSSSTSGAYIYPYDKSSTSNTFSPSPSPWQSQARYIELPSKNSLETGMPTEQRTNLLHPSELFSSSKTSTSSRFPHANKPYNPNTWLPETEKTDIEATLTNKTAHDLQPQKSFTTRRTCDL